MKVKLSVVILVLLGGVAAFSAAMFTTSVRANALSAMAQVTSPDIEILVAAGEIKTMSIITAEMLTTKTVSKSDAPDHYLSEMTQALGQVVVVPLVEGQALTKTYLAKEGTGLNLAARLAPGMRVVGVSLSEYSGLEGLLYPGSTVDVLTTFKLSGSGKDLGEAVSTTLLQNIQVLAVEDQTIVSSPEQKEKGAATSRQRAGNRSLLVMLLVTPKQAEALQLALQFGKISFAMRNPQDDLRFNEEVTLLSQGRLAQMGSVLGASVDSGPYEVAKRLRPLAEEKKPEAPGTVVDESDNRWDMEIIRGGAIETRSFSMPKEVTADES